MRKVYVLGLLGLMTISEAFAGSVYVSATAGSDITGTGSMGNPFKTIAYATAQASVSDTVKIFPGTYMETTDIMVDQSLTFMKEGMGEVVIDGDNRSSLMLNKTFFTVDNASNVTIDGLTMQNLIGPGSRGILVTGAGANISITNNTFINIGWVDSNLVTMPLALEGASAVEVRGNLNTPITDVDITGNTVLYCAVGTSEAVTVNGNVDGFVIANNNIDQVSNIGIDVAGNYSWANPFPAVNQARNGVISGNVVSRAMSGIAASAGIYIDGAYNITVERNEIFESGVGISVGAEQMLGVGAQTVSGIIIRNNLVYDNSVAGIVIGSGTTGNNIESTIVVNNTFVNNRTGATINGVLTIGGDGPSIFADQWGGEVHLQNSSDVTFQNNIVVATTGKMNLVALSGFQVSNFMSDYNLYYSGNGSIGMNINTGVSFNGSTSVSGQYSQLGNFSTATGLEANSTVQAAGFVDASQDDYDLDDNSDAIDAGDPAAANSGSVDFAGNPRTNNGRVDMGAFENQKITNVAGPGSLNRTIALHPNPTSGLVNIEATTAIKSVSVLDIQGKEVMQVAPSKNTVDLSSLQSGVYMLRVETTNNTVTTQKIIRY